jgi:hypothetical protein
MDFPEITLILATPASQCASDTFHQAELKAEALRYALALKSPTPPTIKIMTPKRLPLTLFPFFAELPQETQDIIWSYACNTTRVITIEHTGGAGSDEVKIKNHRVSPILHACQASRSIQKVKYTRAISLPGDQPYPYYNPLLDTVHLPMCRINYVNWAPITSGLSLYATCKTSERGSQQLMPRPCARKRS